MGWYGVKDRLSGTSTFFVQVTNVHGADAAPFQLHRESLSTGLGRARSRREPAQGRSPA